MIARWTFEDGRIVTTPEYQEWQGAQQQAFPLVPQVTVAVLMVRLKAQTGLARRAPSQREVARDREHTAQLIAAAQDRKHMAQLVSATALRRKAELIAADHDEYEAAIQMASQPQYQGRLATLPWNALRLLPTTYFRPTGVMPPDPNRMRRALRYGIGVYVSSQLSPGNSAIDADRQHLPLPDALDRWRLTPIYGRGGRKKPTEELPTTRPHAWALTE